ncbi:MAG: HIT family protein [Bdellovibrionales bacterium]|nr:HIT family protein [Bdellovibrionales bacterium]
MSSIFTKIINGEVPTSFVFKDDKCVAVMDLHPINEGHVLVVPREEQARFADLPSDTVAHLMIIAQKIVNMISESKLTPVGFNLFLSDGELAGQEVPHCHLHILPRYQNDSVDISFGVQALRTSREQLDNIASLIAESNHG